MPRFSRRSFLQFSAAASAAAVLPAFTEAMLAQAARPRMPRPSPGAVIIDANENPLGPCQSARDAMATILPQGGRYQSYLTDDLIKTYAQLEGVKPD
jgi:histidinol-phosphate aminotransferase